MIGLKTSVSPLLCTRYHVYLGHFYYILNINYSELLSFSTYLINQ